VAVISKLELALAYALAMRWHTEADPLDVEFSDAAFGPLQAQQADVGTTLLVGHGHGPCQEVIGVELEGWRSSFGFDVFHVSNGKPHPVRGENSRRTNAT
jgi:predicted homoserine dehydrogenase-like protein